MSDSRSRRRNAGTAAGSSQIAHLKTLLHALVTLYNPYKAAIKKKDYGSLFEASKAIYSSIQAISPAAGIDALLSKLIRQDGGDGKYVRMTQMYYALRGLLDDEEVGASESFAGKMKDEYWASAHRSTWLKEDLEMYTAYLVETHKKNKQKQTDQESKIESLIQRISRMEATHATATGAALVEESEMQERDRQSRLELLEKENEDLKQQIVLLRLENHSALTMKAEFMRKNNLLENQIKDVGRKVLALTVCTKRAEMLDRKVKQLYDSHQILVNHNNILIDMAVSTHYELDVVNAKYTEAQEKLAQCRNPEKIRNLLDETLNSNKALLMLWQQMQMLKSANFINGFFEQIIRLLIMSAGTMKEKPEMLNMLNDQALSQITRPPECSKCTVLKDLLLRILEMMFSCGMNPGPDVMRQVSNAGVMQSPAGGAATETSSRAAEDDFAGLHLEGNALDFTNLSAPTNAAAPALAPQPKKAPVVPKGPTTPISKVTKTALMDKIQSGGGALGFTDDRPKINK